MTTWSDDLWSITPSQLVDGIRQVAEGHEPNPGVERVLRAAFLIDDDGLTSIGRQLFLARWVHNDQDRYRGLLASALQPALVFQILQQELQGYGALPEDGVLNLLRLHKAMPGGRTVTDFRRLMGWANELGLLVYSKKLKTIRVSLPPVDASTVGEDIRLSAVISP